MGLAALVGVGYLHILLAWAYPTTASILLLANSRIVLLIISFLLTFPSYSNGIKVQQTQKLHQGSFTGAATWQTGRNYPLLKYSELKSGKNVFLM